MTFRRRLREAVTKTEDGQQFPAGDYAYVPDPAKPSTWKLRLTATPGGDPDPRIVGAAVAALGKGFRGQKVQVPAADRPKVVARVRAAWRKAHPDADGDTMPPVLREADGDTDAARLWETFDLGIREALDADGDTDAARLRENPDAGWQWRVTMIRPGVSVNRRRYQPQVLAEAVGLYEGARSFDGHRDERARASSSTRDLAGWHANVQVGDGGILESDFHIMRSAPHVRDMFISAWEAGRPDLIGFSHDVSADVRHVVEGGRRLEDVVKIVRVHSVDVVAEASAGGRVQRLVAGGEPEEENEMDPRELFRRFLAEHSELTAGDAMKAFVEENPDLTAAQLADLMDELPAPAPPAAPAVDVDPDVSSGTGTTSNTVTVDGTTVTTAAAEAVLRPGTLQHSMLVREAIARANLPQAVATDLQTQLAKFVGTEPQLVEEVRVATRLWESVRAHIPEPLPGQGGGQVRVQEDEVDKMGKALDGLFANTDVDGVPRFRSIKEAYSRFTGRHPYQMGDEDFARWMLAESAGAVPYAGARLTEAVLSTTWAEALGDSIRRRAIAEYNFAPLNTWRAISETTPVPDFRTNRRFRIGGFDTLAVVGENTAYPALTTPADEEATYAAQKYGGTEAFTFEAATNDDVQALRRIPRNLGRASALTLYRAVWVTTIAGNPATTYDATPLFDAAHGNTVSAALSSSAVSAGRTAIVRQTRLGEASGFIGVEPALLVVPPELDELAFQLTRSAVAVTANSDATVPNRQQTLDYLAIPLLTDTNDWFLFTRPTDSPVIEVGFLNGREEPEILIQDQPAVGAVFTNDRITYRVRHVWGLAVLDHRGAYRGTQV